MNNISFSQDCSCVSVATDTDSRIFNCEPFGEIYHEQVPVFLLKVLFSTSLTIIVPREKDNRLLKIFNLKQKLKICDLIFPSSIVDVKINKKRLVVVLKIGQIYIYDLSYVKLIKIIEIEPLDSQPFVGDLSNDKNALLVIPLKYLSKDSKKNSLFSDPEPYIKFNNPADLKDPKGWVLVYDTISCKTVLIMKCHSSSVKKVVMDNMIIATASSKGTIIRLFHLSYDDGNLSLQKILNLRRGHNLAHINCLRFNSDCSVLACGSDNTVHFFNLKDSEHDEPEGDSHEQDISDHETSYSQSSLLGVESSKLSEDLNENLANLLISKPAVDEEEKDESLDSKYWKLSKKFTSRYTKKILKNLPYQDYFNNLILLPPTRSFNIIKLKDHKPVEIGFIDDLVLLASHSGKFYQYRFDESGRECRLVSDYSFT